MSVSESGVTRRQVLAAGTAFAGYTLAVETVLAQAITTDTSGLAAGDVTIPVGGFDVPVYEARPASGRNAHRAGDPRSSACTSTSRTARGRAITPSRRSCSRARAALRS